MNTKKNIAVVYGGYSSESVVSQKSADGVCSFIDNEKYDIFPIFISKLKWCAIVDKNEYPISKSDFSFIINDKKIIPDFIYITIHGSPGEDGILQGYLKMLNIPHSSSDVLASSLTFNKFLCNSLLKEFGIKVAKSVLIRKQTNLRKNDFVKTGFPCFVKPNAGGSSFGISKVYKFKDLKSAVDKAFKECDEVIIEQYIDGVEITCGLYKTSDKSVIFPLTMVISKNEFFDFEAKYNPEKAQEITPAPIDKKIANEIQNISSFIYDLLRCKGFIRIDYIIQKDKIFLLEINTNPGMTSTSFIPQQIAAKGLNIKDIFTEIIEDALISSTLLPPVK